MPDKLPEEDISKVDSSDEILPFTAEDVKRVDLIEKIESLQALERVQYLTLYEPEKLHKEKQLLISDILKSMDVDTVW